MIFPRTVRDTYDIHSKNVFNANIKHLIALTDTAVSRKFCVNIATKEMLDPIIAIHNDSSANIYEKFKIDMIAKGKLNLKRLRELEINNKYFIAPEAHEIKINPSSLKNIISCVDNKNDNGYS